VQCADQKGLDAAIAEFVFRHGGNILHFEQHQAERQQMDVAQASGQQREGGMQPGTERFYLARVEWDLEGFTLGLEDFAREFQPIADKFSMHWRLARSSYRPRVAIFVSKYDHCLADLLYRQRSGELACEMAAIISNHEDAKGDADFYGIGFHYISVTNENKREAERQQLELLKQYAVDLVVLARYMQVLSAEFIGNYPRKIINIHHSFLPAFVGARPQRQAYERGVKLIGATAHYVTEVLDDGPIIEQGVARVSHRDDLDDLVEKGRDLEKVVLSRAVRWHIENRILLYGNKTVIFE